MENKVELTILCGEDLCTACSACYNICPHKAIAMVENEVGEHHPKVDPAKCVGCGVCVKTCPEIEHNKGNVKRNDKPEIYCCWLKDVTLRKQSTSGGAAYAISSCVLKKGGHVWGAAYDDTLTVKYVEANSLEELTAIQKSKYVQSFVGDAFSKIKEELDKGEIVFFAGTGCHVKGLRSFLRKDYDKLYTMDLVCHGVPGQGVFRRYKERIEKEYGDKMVSYIPRPKRESDGQEVGYYSLASFANRGDVKLERKENSYFVGFQHNLFLRTACYNCQANGERRYSDFTVADFWGLGKVAPFKPYKERTRGISMLALNSSKAKRLFEEFKDSLVYEMRSYEEASISNTQYYKPAIPSPSKAEFKKDYQNKSWDELAAKYMRFTPKEYVLYAVKKFTPPILLLYVKFLAKWIK